VAALSLCAAGRRASEPAPGQQQAAAGSTGLLSATAPAAAMREVERASEVLLATGDDFGKVGEWVGG
jgi:hypothetical protein